MTAYLIFLGFSNERSVARHIASKILLVILGNCIPDFSFLRRNDVDRRTGQRQLRLDDLGLASLRVTDCVSVFRLVFERESRWLQA
jgi:hypothetical protein